MSPTSKENDDPVRDDALRGIALEVVRELREALRSSNAEAVNRARELTEAYTGSPDRRNSVEEIWARLTGTPEVVLQSDYTMLRTGLGRFRGGRPVPSGLRVEQDDDGILVSGEVLAGSVGLLLRFRSDDPRIGTVTEFVDLRALSDGDDGGGYDGDGRYDRDDDRDGADRPRRPDRIRFRALPRTTGLLTVFAFDTTSPTGSGTAHLAVPARATVD